MGPYLTYIKGTAVIALLAAIALGLLALYHAGYHAGENSVQVKWDADKIARDEALQKAQADRLAAINHAQEQHDNDQATIDQLSADARRLRIHLPTACGTTAPGQGPHGGAGVFSDRVDASFAELQDRAASLFSRCDQLNIDAIRANASR